jgi:hypothetical protein
MERCFWSATTPPNKTAGRRVVASLFDCILFWSAKTLFLRATTLAYHQAGVLSARFDCSNGRLGFLHFDLSFSLFRFDI